MDIDLIRIYRYEFLAVCHHLGKFGDHRHCESVDIFNFPGFFTWLHVNICVKASPGKSPPFYVAGYWSCASGYVKCLICQVTSPNYFFEGLCNFMSGNSSLYVTTMPSLVSIGIVIVEICL